MGKYFLSLIIFSSFTGYTQDLTGTWEGILNTERQKGFVEVYYYRFYLKQSGSLVWGVCEGLSEVENVKKIEINKAKLYCKYPISGEIPLNNKSSKILQLFRGSVAEANIPMSICESPFHFDVKYQLSANEEYLAGKWFSVYSYSPRADGAGGIITLRKVSFASPDFVNEYFPKLEKMQQKYFKKDSAYLVKLGLADKVFKNYNDTVSFFDSLASRVLQVNEKQTVREDVVQKIINIDTGFIKIDLYDNGVVDGDTVSVYLNGSKIVSSRRLTSVALHMELELDEIAENELKLFAENLGEIPPNTALMVVTAGEKKIEVNLAASMNKNAIVIFKNTKFGTKDE